MNHMHRAAVVAGLTALAVGTAGNGGSSEQIAGAAPFGIFEFTG